ncbi:MAG: hypothetical protein LAO56_17060 [Acidobacteriia bacterium]|nr:hypothetical protein [Terriglobia bacterium]
MGVYFSPASRNYYTTEFLNSYQGIIILLLQQHYEYQIVTPRTLQEFHGNTLVLPNVRVLDEDEKKWLRSYVANGGKLVITGEDSTALPKASNVVRFAICPGRTYLAKAEKDFTNARLTTETTLLATIRKSPELQLEAPPFVATQIASVDGKPHIFFANFSGLVPGKNSVQKPATDLRVRIPGARRGRLSCCHFSERARKFQAVKWVRRWCFASLGSTREPWPGLSGNDC